MKKRVWEIASFVIASLLLFSFISCNTQNDSLRVIYNEFYLDLEGKHKSALKKTIKDENDIIIAAEVELSFEDFKELCEDINNNYTEVPASDKEFGSACEYLSAIWRDYLSEIHNSFSNIFVRYETGKDKLFRVDIKKTVLVYIGIINNGEDVKMYLAKID